MRVVVAKKPFKGHAVGTVIELSARDVRALLALGRVTPAKDEVVAVVVAESEPDPEPKAKEKEKEKEKRTYRVRNMMAED